MPLKDTLKLFQNPIGVFWQLQQCICKISGDPNDINQPKKVVFSNYAVPLKKLL